jgi:hypothetical protein
MNTNEFYFGLRVDSLENYLHTNLTELREKVLQSTDIAVHQGLKETRVVEQDITTAIEVFKSQVNTTLNPEIEKLVQELLQSNIESLKLITAKEEGVLHQKINNTEVDIKRIKITYDWSTRRRVLIGILALSSIDALMNYSSYLVITKYLFLAISLSLATAIGLSLSAHPIGKRMQKALTRKAKWIWFLSGLVGGGIVFFGLGLLRLTYLRDNGLLANSPIIWMLLNNFFFAIAIILAYTKLPTETQEKEKQSKDEKLAQLESLKNEKKTLLENLSKEELKFNECKQKLESFKVYRIELLNKLDNEKDHLISNCIREFTIKSGLNNQPPKLIIQKFQKS